MPSIHANNYDRVADIYDATRGLSPEVEQQVGDGLARLLEERGARSVLEVGIGTGRIAVLLAARGVKVTGVDISTAMLQKLREKRHDVGVVLAESSSLPFRPASFDAVIFSHILHLVPDATAAVAAAAACLRPGGILLNCEHTYGEYPEQGAGKRLNEIILEVTGRPGRAHARGINIAPLLADSLPGVGATIETHRIAEWTDVNTLRRELARLEIRANSNTWLIPDEKMPEIVRRFTAEALEIFGGMDVESRAPALFTVEVARLPT